MERLDTVVRHAAVAGRFYPGDRAELLADVRSYLSASSEATAAIGCLMPDTSILDMSPVPSFPASKYLNLAFSCAPTTLAWGIRWRS
jgi:predicted class III extradiol MEMO1 family dioxygenase